MHTKIGSALVIFFHFKVPKLFVKLKCGPEKKVHDGSGPAAKLTIQLFTALDELNSEVIGETAKLSFYSLLLKVVRYLH
jgi:hypothetical protein